MYSAVKTIRIYGTVMLDSRCTTVITVKISGYSAKVNLQQVKTKHLNFKLTSAISTHVFQTKYIFKWTQGFSERFNHFLSFVFYQKKSNFRIQSK